MGLVISSKTSKFIDKIESYLKERRNKKIFIKRESAFCWSEICGLQRMVDSGEFKIAEITEIIETGGDYLKDFFIAEVPCFECQSYYVNCNLSKTNLIKLIKDELDTTCDKCKEKLKNQQAKKEKENSGQTIEENTVWYISQYLNPEYVWPSGQSVWDKIQRLQPYGVSWDKISDHIKAMPYKEFLKTPYWKAITQKKMKEAGFKCQMCNKEGLLSTHHRTYDIHGMEIFNLKELIVICQDCHKKHHNKE